MRLGHSDGDTTDFTRRHNRTKQMQETKETVGEITKYKDNIHTNRLIQGS